jgi:hypothetical protein
MASRAPAPPEGKLPDDDPRSIVQGTVTYLENNQQRMNYPDYRRQGLPVSTSMIESLIKEMNYRVKGTEKFWNRPEGAEQILQIRAAALCDDDRLSNGFSTAQARTSTADPPLKSPLWPPPHKIKSPYAPAPPGCTSAFARVGWQGLAGLRGPNTFHGRNASAAPPSAIASADTPKGSWWAGAGRFCAATTQRKDNALGTLSITDR